MLDQGDGLREVFFHWMWHATTWRLEPLPMEIFQPQEFGWAGQREAAVWPHLLLRIFLS